MIDKLKFKQAFSLLHASEDCLKEVKNMSVKTIHPAAARVCALPSSPPACALLWR